jgi:hypothetical protein
MAGQRHWRSAAVNLLQRVRALDLGPQHCCSAVEEVRYRGAFFPPVVPELGRQQRERQQAAVNLLVRDCPDRAKQLVVESGPAVDLPIRSPVQPRQQAGDDVGGAFYRVTQGVQLAVGMAARAAGRWRLALVHGLIRRKVSAIGIGT